MNIRAISRAGDFAVPPALPEAFVDDEDYLPGTDVWSVLESLRSARMSAEERDAEDERFVALMLGGDAFD